MPTFNQQITINGLVRTDQPVWQNIESLTEATGSWFTYNTYTGQYAWIINQAGNATVTLTENDIIGTIGVSASSLTNLYNSVEVEYPSREIRDQPNYVRLDLPGGLRNDYEPDNTLQISNDFINTDIQAEIIAQLTLRQSRLDKSVTFRTDWSHIGIAAGDIIAITSDTYGWTAKEWRVMRVREIEGDDGSLQLEFLASEYDDSIYDFSDLAEFLIGGTPGIRSITAIGVPGTPTVELVTLDSLPAQRVSSTVPAGIVERMQFWAANVAITGNVANSTFQLYGSLASPDAAAWTVNAAATFTTTALRDGTWAWKTRGVNALGVGPFSDGSANVIYVRDQAPDVIIDDTPIVNNVGNVVGSNITTFTGNVANTAIADFIASGNLDGNVYQPGNNITFTSGTGNIKYINATATSNLAIGGITEYYQNNQGLLDLLQFTSNLVLRGMIYTDRNLMFAVNAGNVSEVGFSIPDNVNEIVIDGSMKATANSSDFSTLGIPQGAAVYLSKADWDSAEYTANGFSGLSWTDWIQMGVYRDNYNNLPAENRIIDVDGGRSYALSNSDPSIYAVGFSGTKVANINVDYGAITDPISGDSTAGVIVGFFGNTVIIDTNSGNAIVETPGITANAIVAFGPLLEPALNSFITGFKND